MAILRILFSILFFISTTQVFAESPGAGAPAAVEATETNIPQVTNIRQRSSDFGIHAPTMQKATTQLNEAVASCESKKKVADGLCLESLNPDITKFMAENGQLVSMGMMVAGSIGEQCKGLSATLNKANIVLGAYTASCSVAQAVCTSSCAKVEPARAAVRQSASHAVMALGTDMQETCSVDMSGAACAKSTAEYNKGKAAEGSIESELSTIQVGTGKKEHVCTKYRMSASNAMLGAVTALQGYAKSKACEEANKNTDIASIDCTKSDSPGYSSINCQCARGEKSAAECQNIRIQASARTNVIAPNGATGSGSEPPAAMPFGGDVGGDAGKIAATGATAGGAPAPVDGGGGAGMGGGSAGGGYGQDGAAGTRRLNTNVLGGGFGGGGGGGGSGGGPGYGEDSKLKAYSPGGSNDPNRSIASQLAKEVSAPAGRSNWEKIRLRYKDNTGTLLNK